MEEPLFSYAPHPLLAQQNMQVMNSLGMNVMTLPTDLPGERSWKVVTPMEPLRPFAETVIRGYLTLLSRNNLCKLRFVGQGGSRGSGIAGGVLLNTEQGSEKGQETLVR